jgi:DNA polymerase III alpha subunit
VEEVEEVEYAELHCHSGFSLLDGASTPERLVARARALGYQGLALTDHDDLGGIVRHLQAGQQEDLPVIAGAELTLEGEHHLTVLAGDRQGWARLSTLVATARMRGTGADLTRSRTRTADGARGSGRDRRVTRRSSRTGADRERGADRGLPRVRLAELLDRPEGLFVLSGCPRGGLPTLLRQGREAEALRFAGRLHEAFGDRFAVEVMDHDTPEESALVAPLVALARRLDVPWVVTGNVHYAERSTTCSPACGTGSPWKRRAPGCVPTTAGT